jgi:hypothetical protein
MFMWVYTVCVVRCVGSGLAKDSSSAEGVISTVRYISKLKRKSRTNKMAIDPTNINKYEYKYINIIKYLEWILERWDGVMWTGLVWLRMGTGGKLL